MAVITNLTEQKNKKRVNVFVDNSFFCGISRETMVKNGIKVGLEIDENKLKNIIFESEVRRAQDYCLTLVASKPYSHFEIKQKLSNKGFDDLVIIGVIKKLDEYNLIDDALLAKAVVESSKYDGRRKIEQKLIKKGLSKTEIESAENMLTNEGESSKIDVISAKYMKNKEKTLQNLQKLYRHLLARGFDYELCKKGVEKFKEIDDESWD